MPVILKCIHYLLHDSVDVCVVVVVVSLVDDADVLKIGCWWQSDVGDNDVKKCELKILNSLSSSLSSTTTALLVDVS